MADLQTTVGAVIRRLRRERYLTLRELARRAALSLVYLGEIERGKKYPSARVLEELARALDLDVADLLDHIATELRPVMLPVPRQPVALNREPATDATPRAALGLVQVWSPAEVVTVILMGGGFVVGSNVLPPPLVVNRI